MATVAVTGANRGIGLGLARHYLARGDTVYALCRSPETSAALTELAAAHGDRLRLQSVDIASDAVVEAAAAQITDPLDLLINNAGIFGNKDQTLTGLDTGSWLEVFNVNAIGPFRVSRALLPNLKVRAGKIAVISSHVASSTWAMAGFYAYGSSKAAANRIVRGLAMDLRPYGIAVACVHPGHVQTEMAAPGAQLTAGDSAAGICEVMEKLTLEQSGSFLRWNGESQPW